MTVAASYRTKSGTRRKFGTLQYKVHKKWERSLPTEDERDGQDDLLSIDRGTGTHSRIKAHTFLHVCIECSERQTSKRRHHPLRAPVQTGALLPSAFKSTLLGVECGGIYVEDCQCGSRT